MLMEFLSPEIALMDTCTSLRNTEHRWDLYEPAGPHIVHVSVWIKIPPRSLLLLRWTFSLTVLCNPKNCLAESEEPVGHSKHLDAAISQKKRKIL